MTVAEIRNRFDEFCNIFTFQYRGKNCYFDPISRHDKWIYDVMCGDKSEQMSFDSLDAVLTTPLFWGKSLSEIAKDITITEW